LPEDDYVFQTTYCSNSTPKVVGGGILGGALGLFVGSQYDIILNVDAQIVGLVLGSMVGSLL
jgi:hypothetical protein